MGCKHTPILEYTLQPFRMYKSMYECVVLGKGKTIFLNICSAEEGKSSIDFSRIALSQVRW